MAALTERSVLVTGAFGHVGRYVLDRLPRDESRVVATDVPTPANRRAAEQWHWQDTLRRVPCSRVWQEIAERWGPSRSATRIRSRAPRWSRRGSPR